MSSSGVDGGEVRTVGTHLGLASFRLGFHGVLLGVPHGRLIDGAAPVTFDPTARHRYEVASVEFAATVFLTRDNLATAEPGES